MHEKMKVLILNSGMGTRLGQITERQPKCFTKLYTGETILERQINIFVDFGIKDFVITTGFYDKEIRDYCKKMDNDIRFTFVQNEIYDKTNYIYSIFCAKDFLDDDIILLHGDLVFEPAVLAELLKDNNSVMITSSSTMLPEKDFKAVIDGQRIKAVGVEFFESAIAAQPFYKMNRKEWLMWLNQISVYCNQNQRNCYAEKAFNDISDDCVIYPVDVKDKLCNEIDTYEDLQKVNDLLTKQDKKTVYMSFSTDILHGGHISIINKAKKMGKVIIGLLADEAVISYKHYPLLPYSERKILFENINGVSQVIEQKELNYRRNLEMLHPDYVVHGDDWKNGIQKSVREDVIKVLNSYGGTLVEYPYSKEVIYRKYEERARQELSIPDIRRGRLKKTLEMKGLITAMEAHSGITGLIVENTKVYEDGKAYQFDAMWISSLCDSTAKGKPDIELVDMTSRFRTIDDIMEVTSKPIIFDGDTGGLTEHFVYTVKTLERIGVSMIIIEDKTGLKKNSLFGTEVVQTQDSIENFCEKISAGKRAQKTKDFLIVARVESLILDKGMQDALERAFAYVQAGADGIMIHSRRKEPTEIFEFVEKFREVNETTPIIVVPTSFNSVTEEEFKARGINIVIYANQLTRSSFPAMKKTAEKILKCHRCKEADEEYCMPFKEIITLIPEDN